MGLLDKIRKTKKQEEEPIKKAGVAEPKKTEVKEVKKTEKPAVKKVVKKGKMAGNAYKTLVRPIVSEKAAVHETLGQYTFAVASGATKKEIKDAVEIIYGVRPIRVHTLNFEGKRVRFGRHQGRRKDWKKAVVKLPKGKTLSIHEGV